MDVLQFNSDNNDFAKELRKRVREYFKSNGSERFGSYKILFKTWVMLLVYFVPFGFILSGFIGSLGVYFAAWFVMGLGMAGIGLVTMHDANHGAFSKHNWMNKLYGGSLYLLGGFPANWRHQHNILHHGYTNIEGYDEDIAPSGILRFSPHKPIRKIHKYQYIYAWFLYGLMTLSWVTAKDFKRLKKYKHNDVVLSNKTSYRSLYIKLLVSKVLYYALFVGVPMVTIPFHWAWVLLGFFIMHFTSGFILSIIFQSAHVVPSSDYPQPNESNEMEDSWAIHQLHTTCDFAPKSRLFSWLIGGLNYQVVHHLFPNISHVHYRPLSLIIADLAQKYSLPYHVNKTFIGAIYQHGLMLKRLGTIA